MPVSHVDENYKQVQKYINIANALDFIMRRPKFAEAIQDICIDSNIVAMYPEINSQVVIEEICDAIRFKTISIQQTVKNYIKE